MTRKEQADRSKAALIEAARSCFTELGYDSTTVAGILDRAGMARGALYHYFPNGKAQIFSAVFDSVNERFHDRRDALLGLTSPLERLRAGIAVFLELCTEREFARIALTDAPRLIPGQANLGSSYRLLRDQLADASAVGEVLVADVDLAAVAVYGAVRAAGDQVASAHQPAEALAAATSVLGQLLDGLRPEVRPR